MKKRICLVLIVMISIFVFIGIHTFKTYGKLDIDSVLSSSSYSYLSSDVLNYIKSVYEETGEVLLTEKNKKQNKPYLNPQYVEYLEYINNGGELLDGSFKYDVIPSMVIVDYVYDSKYDLLGEDNLPTKFDLRNVLGENFVTPIKDQESTGLCWSFATNAQAESHLLVKNNTSYKAGETQIFSEMQIDYATASNSVIDGDPLYSFSRILSDGGTFKWATSVMKDGLGLVDVSWRDFSTYDEKPMEKNKIYNFSNSKYDVISTVDYPKLDLGTLDLSVLENVTKRENYLNNLKQLIMDNGGAYVSTGDPSSRCAISVNGYKMIYDDTLCASAGHAMQVIGWDDDFEYSFCSGEKDSYGYYYLGNANNCSTGKVISGRGAWLLKNSWGSILPYVYLAYDSIGTEYNMITELETRDWDNHYTVSRLTGTKYMFSPVGYLTEKLNKIKFSTTSQNYTLEVCAKSSLSGQICKDVLVTYPGIYTVDFSLDDLYIGGNLFVELSKGIGTSIDVYTNILDEDMLIETEDIVFKNRLTNVDKYMLRVPSITSNVPEGSIVEYKILDGDEEISSNYTYSENIVSANFIYAKLIIDSDLELGTYTLQTILNGEVMDSSRIDIKEKNVVISGTGDIDDPYIIKTPAQLNLIRSNRFAYYELANDIDLTYDTKNYDGLFYNGGAGWEPISYSTGSVSSYYNDLTYSKGFSGGFDGKGFTIKGLYIYRPHENGVGLFANTYNENYSDLYIKNVILENPTIVGYSYVGALVGHVNGTTYERMTNISNVSVIGGKVKGEEFVGGIIGGIRAGSYLKKYGTSDERHKFSDLYNSAFVDAYRTGGGIAGKVMNTVGYKEGNCPIIIENVSNKGKVFADVDAGGLVGKVILKDNNTITIRNSINTGVIEGDYRASNIFSTFISLEANGQLVLNNIYYLNEENLNSNNDMISFDNVSNKSIDDMKKIDTFASWDNFSEHWKIEEVDGIYRFPVLRNMKFDYLSIDDITLNIGNEAMIDDYITPDIGVALNNSYTVLDSSIINFVNNKISAIKVGSTKIHVVSTYDGLEKDVMVNVIDDGTRTIKYYKNKSLSKEYVQTVPVGMVTLLDCMFSVEGYVFKEWNTQKNGNGISYLAGQEIDVTTNLELYAQWEPSIVILTLDSNDGRGVTEIQEFLYGEQQAIKDNVFPKEGYYVKEWNTRSDGSGTGYYSMQSITIYEDTTLYAIWEIRKLNVMFYSNNDFNKVTFQEFAYGESQKLKSNIFSRPGYTFKEWNTMADGTGTIYSDGQEVVLTEPLTLYAQWEKEGTYIIDKYIVDEVNKYIDMIDVNTSKDEFIDNITVTGEYSVSVDTVSISGKEILYTGGKTRIYRDGVLVVEYTNIIRGDITGDGIIDYLDYVYVYNHIYKSKHPESDKLLLDGASLVAADASNDDIVDYLDYVKIYNKIKELKGGSN